MKKMMLASFLLVLSGAAWADTPELGREKVAKIWPYPEKVIKVISAKGLIESEGRTVRLSDVVTKSTASGTCQISRTQFYLSASGWQFGSVDAITPVSCKTLKASGPSQGLRGQGQQDQDDKNKVVRKIHKAVITGLSVKNAVGF